MISQGNVVLTAARRDCDLPSAGGMNIVEFSDRARKANPSLTDLRGKVACMSTKAVTGYYTTNYNSGGRRNYCEANVFSLGSNHNHTLGKSGNTLTMRSETYGIHDAMGGFTFCGTISGGGNYRFRYNYRSTNSERHQLEIIGWTAGFFSGSADYKTSYLGAGTINETPVINLNGSYPYVTLIIQSFSPGGFGGRAESEIYDAWIEKV